jgi:hypothetical protein
MLSWLQVFPKLASRQVPKGAASSPGSHSIFPTIQLFLYSPTPCTSEGALTGVTHLEADTRLGPVPLLFL